MIDPKALDKLVENSISIVSFKDGKVHSARMIRDARVDWSGRVYLGFPKDSQLAGFLKNTDAFTLSVLMEGTNASEYENLFLRFDMDYYAHDSKFHGLKCIKRDRNGLYSITECTNAIISCKIDEIIEYRYSCRIYGSVTESRLLHDNPTLTDDVYRRTLKKRFAAYVCVSCGMLYHLEYTEADYCVYCNGRLWPIF